MREIDALWVLSTGILVFTMQAGFLCLETGLTRNKNNINTAIKNLADFGISTVMFWIAGFALMFGASKGGVLGINYFVPDLSVGDDQIAFFFFQVMFCGTAVTIISGAIAERTRFDSYIIVAMLVSTITYPVFGHWVWNSSTFTETGGGWLQNLGFVDFAGSSAVHSVGGWASLAILMLIGARNGRFDAQGNPVKVPAANLPLATLGVMILWFGWFGFNAGSTLQMNHQAALIAVNTVMGGSTGLCMGIALAYLLDKKASVDLVMNGTLAGLVAVTANCHAVTMPQAALIGAIGTVFMVATDKLLLYFKIDDAVGAVPVHLGAGIWGTLAVGIFANLEVLGTGLNRGEQIGVQLLGIVVCGVWVSAATYFPFRALSYYIPMRVTPENEEQGLNISEHGESTELIDLYQVMEQQEKRNDFSLRVPVLQRMTEVGQIAERYNRLMESLQNSIINGEYERQRRSAYTLSAQLVTTSIDMGASIRRYLAPLQQAVNLNGNSPDHFHLAVQAAVDCTVEEIERFEQQLKQAVSLSEKVEEESFLEVATHAVMIVCNEKHFPAERVEINIAPNFTIGIPGLKRVIYHLIKNAIESIPDSKMQPTIWIQATHMAYDKGWIISIADNGEGIPDVYRDRIMVQGFSTRSQPGEGLWLVTYLLRLYAIELEFESRPMNGTTFHFMVPSHYIQMDS